MRLLSWNVNFRRNVEAQMDAALVHAPDIVVLQEVRRASFDELRERFDACGLAHFVTSADAPGSVPVLGRFVVIASRYPLAACAPVLAPAPDATVAVQVDAPSGPFELIGAYVPTIARPDGVKVPTQMAIFERMRHAARRPHVLCGDFNSPKAETPDGEIVLFTRQIRAAEYEGEGALMGGLTQFGLTDAFRACNGYLADDRSWYWKNRGRTGGYRLDHLFVSQHFETTGCWYDHSVRERGLSDHSLLVAEVNLRQEAGHFPAEKNK
jgi:exonuclease III